ncbi:MAG: peptidoglycan-binding protein [Pseudomonadota bacterium]
MSRPILRLNDGYDHTSPELRDEVKELQNELKQEGYALDADGFFGRDTEAALKQFQSEHNLDDDGVAGALTWAALLGTPPLALDKVYPTTIPRNDSGYLRQLDAATHYLAFIKQGAQQYGIDAPVLGGLGSRESRWGLALQLAGAGGTGDFAERGFPARFRQGALPPDGGGFGRGLMQIDFDAHEFARTGNWQDPQQNILYGCKVLSDCLSFFQRKQNLQGKPLLRAALAAYNCGPGNVLKAIRNGLDVDFYTAHRDYSKDVLNRAGFFQLNGWE